VNIKAVTQFGFSGSLGNTKNLDRGWLAGSELQMSVNSSVASELKCMEIHHTITIQQGLKTTWVMHFHETFTQIC
jgi:hypothetical protein